MLNLTELILELMPLWVLLLALLLDRLFSEVRKCHPLVGFGRMANYIEARFNHDRQQHQQSASAWRIRATGLLAYALLLLPFLLLSLLLQLSLPWWWLQLLSALVLYFAIGWRSLLQHAVAIYQPLQQGDLAQARYRLSMIVSRQCEQLDEQQIAQASCESVLENGADAIFAAIFWYLVAGVPGVLMYRLVNTLDAMWGYKNARFYHFGYVAAKVDDMMNLIPARLTGISYALAGHTAAAFKSWHRQQGLYKSPNAGLVMAAGAGALGITLGGAAYYHGQLQQRPSLGIGTGAIKADHIDACCRLVNRSLVIWCISLLFLCLIKVGFNV